MKSIVTNWILKLAKNRLVSYVEKLLADKNVSVKAVGEKAEKAAQICSHLATLCQNASDICADDKVDAEELSKAVKDISAFIGKIKTTLN